MQQQQQQKDYQFVVRVDPPWRHDPVSPPVPCSVAPCFGNETASGAAVVCRWLERDSSVSTRRNKSAKRHCPRRVPPRHVGRAAVPKELSWSCSLCCVCCWNGVSGSVDCQVARRHCRLGRANGPERSLLIRRQARCQDCTEGEFMAEATTLLWPSKISLIHVSTHVALLLKKEDVTKRQLAGADSGIIVVC